MNFIKKFKGADMGPHSTKETKRIRKKNQNIDIMAMEKSKYVFYSV